MATLPNIKQLKAKGFPWKYDEEPREIRKAYRLAIKKFGDRFIRVYRNPNIDVWVFDFDLNYSNRYPISYNILRKKLKRLFPKLFFCFINKQPLKIRKPKDIDPKLRLELEFKQVQDKLLRAKKYYYKKHKSIMTDYEFDTLEKYSFKLARELGFRADKYKGPKKNEKHHIHWMIGYKGGV